MTSQKSKDNVLVRAVLPHCAGDILIAAQLVSSLNALEAYDGVVRRNAETTAKFLLDTYSLTKDSNLEHVLLVAYQVKHFSLAGEKESAKNTTNIELALFVVVQEVWGNLTNIEARIGEKRSKNNLSLNDD